MNDAVDAALADGGDQKYPRINRRIRLKNPRGPPNVGGMQSSINDITLPSDVHQSVEQTDNTILIDQNSNPVIQHDSRNKAGLGLGS